MINRQWYRFTCEGIEYEVYASSPDMARGNFLIWYGPGLAPNTVFPDWVRVAGFEAKV